MKQKIAGMTAWCGDLVLMLQIIDQKPDSVFQPEATYPVFRGRRLLWSVDSVRSMDSVECGLQQNQRSSREVRLVSGGPCHRRRSSWVFSPESFWRLGRAVSSGKREESLSPQFLWTTYLSWGPQWLKQISTRFDFSRCGQHRYECFLSVTVLRAIAFL